MPERIRNIALKSSAGAGKTRALTKRFLYLYLHKVNYQLKSLYGITFTNEAAFEMKTRVLEYLDLLITGTSKEPADVEIIDHFQRCYPDIKQRARGRRKHLLNNLGEFNIFTFHSMFASFLSSIPFAAGILPGYRIIDETNEAILYETILDEYFEIGRRKEKQHEFMKDFVRQSEVRVKKSIRSIYRSVTPWLDFLSGLLSREKDFMDKVKIRVTELSNVLRALINFIQEHLSAAYTKNSTQPNKDILRLCRKIGDFLESKNFKTLEKSEYTKSILRSDLVDKRYITRFVDNLGTAKTEIEKIFKNLSLCVNDYLHALSDQQIVLHLKPILEIHRLYEKEKRVRNLVSFDDIELLTLRALKMSPDLDYLYFKLGAEISHLMIDEFQDTSYRQLEIILPLVDEILALAPAEKSLFYVGDPKQAIYRWRGGSSELFDVLTEQYAEKITPEKLTTNYRSKKEVIEFVNEVLDKKDEADEDNSGGWIRVENIGDHDDERGQQEVIDRTAEIIKELVDDYNYDYSDIAVLVRTNKYGLVLSESFSKSGIPHSSTSKCNLLSNPDVRTICRILEFLDDPQNDFALLHILFSCSFDLSEEVVRRLMHPGRTLFLCLRDAHPGWQVTKKLEKLLGVVHLLNPYDLIFTIYEVLELNITSALTTLLDVALEYTTEETGHLSSFLNWLSRVGDTINIHEMQPEGVQILTVHKAKGLEFGIILLPETNWSLRSDEDPKLLFAYKTNGIEPEKIYWRNYGKYLPGLKEAEQSRLEKDEMNLLYVALTRARSGIHVLCFHHRKRGFGFWPEKIVEKIGDLPLARGEIVKKRTIKPEVTTVKEYGAIQQEPIVLREERVLYSPTDRALDLVDTSRRRGMEFGTMVHYALSNIIWLDDVDVQSFVTDIVDKVCRKYARTSEEKVEIKRKLIPLLTTTLNDPDLRFIFFKDGRDVQHKNEIAIYFEEKNKDVSGQIDRLIIGSNNITIVDYKTGEVDTKHKQQLKVYNEGISKIYHDYTIDSMLVYLDNTSSMKIARL